MPLRRISGWISLWLSLAPATVLAQANVCRVPDRLDLPDVRKPYDEPSRAVAIRGYTLALSWSPAYCASHPDSRPTDGQCEAGNGRFGFIVHGLWPEGQGRAYPQWCTPAVPVPQAVARAQYCVTPSPRLIAHEWAKHGRCATNDPARYFAASRRIFATLRFPDMTALGGRRITVGRFKQLFAGANPAIPVAALTIGNDSGLLHEVRICLDLAFNALSCPRSRRGAPDQAPIVIIRGP